MAAKGPRSVEPLADAVLLLRPWEERDLPLLERATADEYVALIERLPTPLTPERARAWVAAKSATELAIEERASGEAVGGVGYAFRHVPGMAELGYWIEPDRRRCGFAARAARLLADWALAEGGVERLQSVVEPWNLGSQRVLESAGFEREGFLRGYSVLGEGPRRDVFLYARLV